MKKSRVKRKTVPPEILKIRTSKQWSLLDAVSRKISIPVENLESMILKIDSETLEKSGLWIQKIGDCYIICSNPSYRAHASNNRKKKCTCCRNVKGSSAESMKRYFGSTDYNAGRHSTGEKHKPQCPMWKPPSAGHLHSWRRGYKKKK